MGNDSENGPELEAVIVAAAAMHPNLPGCDATEPKVCDVCHEAAGDMLDRVVPGVLASMGLDEALLAQLGLGQ